MKSERGTSLDRGSRLAVSRIVALLAVAVPSLWAPPPSRAQDRDAQIMLGFGAVVYDGASNESGVGVSGRLQYEVALASTLRLGIEAGAHTLSAVAQTCTLGVPSTCSPETPASPVFHLRAALSRDLFRSAPIYLTGGLGLYGPVGQAERARDLAAGIDVGAGIRLSPHVALEVSYLNLRTGRHLGDAIPFGLKVRL